MPRLSCTRKNPLIHPVSLVLDPWVHGSIKSDIVKMTLQKGKYPIEKPFFSRSLSRFTVERGSLKRKGKPPPQLATTSNLRPLPRFPPSCPAPQPHRTCQLAALHGAFGVASGFPLKNPQKGGFRSKERRAHLGFPSNQPPKRGRGPSLQKTHRGIWAVLRSPAKSLTLSGLNGNPH